MLCTGKQCQWSYGLNLTQNLNLQIMRKIAVLPVYVLLFEQMNLILVD